MLGLLISDASRVPLPSPQPFLHILPLPSRQLLFSHLDSFFSPLEAVSLPAAVCLNNSFGSEARCCSRVTTAHRKAGHCIPALCCVWISLRNPPFMRISLSFQTPTSSPPIELAGRQILHNGRPILHSAPQPAALHYPVVCLMVTLGTAPYDALAMHSTEHDGDHGCC